MAAAPITGATAPMEVAPAPTQISGAIPGEETTPPGPVPADAMPPGSVPVPGAPEPQPTPGAIPGAAPVPVVGGGKIEMILAVLAFLITIGCVVVLAIMSVE